MKINTQKWCGILKLISRKTTLSPLQVENYKIKSIICVQCRLLHSQCILRKESKELTYQHPVFYHKERLKALEKLEDSGIDIYFQKYINCRSLADVITQYSHLKAKEEANVLLSVRGRVISLRCSGKGLYFYDILENGAKLQIVTKINSYLIQNEFKLITNFINKGDYIGVEGHVMKTARGELSVLASKLHILGANLTLLPVETDVLHLRTHFIDLFINTEVRKKFIQRTDIINHIRSFLMKQNFLQVKTPILIDTPSGAIAKPFRTLDINNRQLFFRIAPELFLKMLVVGEMQKVFEIGPQFRNESVDKTHYPVFTTCEFYAAHADYNDFMHLTEEMLSELVYKLFGSYKISYDPGKKSGEMYEIDFKPPFARIDVMSALESKLNTKFPAPADLDFKSSQNVIFDICNRNGVIVDSGMSAAKLIDKLCDEFLVSNFVNPTFLINHPIVMSPLAKAHRDIPGLSERFELFVAHLELCNAYTELNDPKEQEVRFRDQSKYSDGMESHASFVNALMHGLPPTAGWGMGIDRLVMLLTNSQNINEVILFPGLKPSIKRLLSKGNDPAPEVTSRSITQPVFRTKNKTNDHKVILEGPSLAYYINRQKEKAILENNGFKLYPHTFKVSHSLPELERSYSNLKPGQVTSDIVSVTGRAKTTRKKEHQLSTCSMFHNDIEIQLDFNEDYYLNSDELRHLSKFIARGDQLGTMGYVTRTQSGELSLRVTKLQILAPCLVPLPVNANDSNERYVDMILNSVTRDRFRMIADVIDHLSEFLKEKQFLEVETPVLIDASNETAISFETFLEKGGKPLYVCKSPQLYLIRGLVAGFSKVCEIRTQFRKVLPSRISHPEFTTCQFFTMHADYDDIMQLTEAMLSELVYKLFGSYKKLYNSENNSDNGYELNFETPFRRVDVMSELKNKLGIEFPHLETLESENSREFFVDVCHENGITVQSGLPTGKLIRMLCDKMIIPEFINPTFFINHPLVMCPMAKSHRDINGLGERVELYAGGMQLGTGFTVINDSRYLKAGFTSNIFKENGIVYDTEYLHALKFGLPSSAGCTIGVERLAMLLCNCQDIKQVILFPK